MKLIVVYLLIAVAFFHKSYGNAITLDEYGVSSGLTFLDNATRAGVTCQAQGTFCSNDITECDSVFVCSSPGAIGIGLKCPEGQSCNDGKCDLNKSPSCEFQGQSFTCSTEGMYPEPSSCKKYNYCIPDKANPMQVDPKPVEGTCPPEWGYNPANTFCDKKLTKDVCAPIDRPVPQCTKEGQNGALKTNPVLYYYCVSRGATEKVLYPLILKCPNNQKYIGNLQCK